MFRPFELLNLQASSLKFLSLEQGFGISGEARIDYYPIKNGIRKKNSLIALKSGIIEPFIGRYSQKPRTSQNRK